MATPIDSRTFFGINAAQPKQQLSMEVFMRLLTVQLANQNPLEPMNDRDFFAQMAQLGQVQGTDKMVKQLNVIQASSLIGKTVDATRSMTDTGSDGQNSLVTGVVKRMSVRNGEYYLGIQEAGSTGEIEIRFDSIQSIHSTEN